jgi:hypothetical protein
MWVRHVRETKEKRDDDDEPQENFNRRDLNQKKGTNDDVP